MLVKWSPVLILSYAFVEKRKKKGKVRIRTHYVMLVNCSPIVISSYRFIQKMKGDNSNPLKTKNND